MDGAVLSNLLRISGAAPTPNRRINMATLASILMILAFLLFVIDAFANTGWRINLQSLGLACFVASILAASSHLIIGS